MSKMRLFGVICLAVLLGILAGCTGGGEEEKLKKITIAEPVHLTGYLPLYAAIHEGYFEEEGLDVEVVTATGGAHVTTVVSGDAWGNIAGPDSNALANIDSNDPIVSVVNVVNRANVYLMAGGDTPPAGASEEELAAYLEGKTIAAGRYGGSPNLLTRYLIMELGMEPGKDVLLEEPADASAVVSLVENGQADIANGAEPQIYDGIEKGVWNEPFYGFPSLGDYPYSVISVKQSTIDEDPETVQKFVEAITKALKAVDEDEELAMRVLKKEFPTTEEASLQASLDRAYADELWSKDGYITEEATDKTIDVVTKTGVYKGDYKYEELVNMEFVEALE
ncbi:nitrate ABC transporter substrate-binding protein [Terribacillus saccharophilus]|uniref:ABC transporter substrate-binding protein n=1 Tax=Terribacillus saccharophilus TaxID=361277 RepID=UPI000BA689F1|nr:ABC transporter substrate-binding protein [Terribacillus saccharophilus]PAF18749.1 nitrate ABC transporter substrate-binding protein [Terribacillus saccharophilus]PAF23310.1 nitrate ABC transporter substrate-binding protein [Terribacillus saccharophilus]PAF35328.1 nitrate ABC transporter substrate-binding protein [Terribacillus saccharophilus]PAF36994.1 nitrate ABC transporter substrate-binding protein [Terribacillus saccharophilus]